MVATTGQRDIGHAGTAVLARHRDAHRPLALKSSSSAHGSRRSRSRAAASGAKRAASAWATASASVSSRIKRASGAGAPPAQGRLAPAASGRGWDSRGHGGLRLSSGVARGQHAVQVVVADQLGLPAHRIVQRMGARIAPVAVEVVSGARGRGTGQLEQFLAGLQRDLGGQHLGLRHRHRGARAGRGVERAGGNGVERASGVQQDLARGVHIDLQAPTWMM